jgi:hypothetical protein
MQSASSFASHIWVSVTEHLLPLPVRRGRVGVGGFSHGRFAESMSTTRTPTLPSPGVPGEGKEGAALQQSRTISRHV